MASNTFSGRVFKSTDEGRNWVKLADLAPERVFVGKNCVGQQRVEGLIVDDTAAAERLVLGDTVTFVRVAVRWLLSLPLSKRAMLLEIVVLVTFAGSRLLG